MLKLMPCVVTLTSKQKKTDGYIRFSVVKDDIFYNCTAFKGSAGYLDEYAKVGAKLFFEDWYVKQNKVDGRIFVDFNVNRLSIVKNGGDK